MTDTMVDRVARAIFIARGGPDIDPGPHWQVVARSAITAMREPTLAMEQAMASARRSCPQMAWKAGIDAAIEEARK